MRKTFGVALIIVGAMVLGGCSPVPLVETQMSQDVALPTPLAALAPVAPVKDGRTDEPVKVTLMYLSEDGQRLVAQEPTLWLKEDANLLEQVISRLLEGPAIESPRPVSLDDAPVSAERVTQIAPSGTKLLSAELVNGIATVDLSSEARNQTQLELLYMRTALVNTVSQLPGVSYVNLLIGGQVEGMGEQIVSMPSGILTYDETPLPAIWLQMMAEEEHMAPNDEPRQIELMAAIYFASTQDERVIPVARRVKVQSNDMMMPLLREMMNNPVGLPKIGRVIPEGIDPLVATPMITSSSDGRRVINLLMRSSFEDEMRARGLSLSQFYGAVTLTLTQFVPEVDGVVVRVGNRRVDAVAGAQEFRNGVMTAKDFQAQIGDEAGIYLHNGKGKLIKVGRVLDPYAATHPRTLIEQLIAGPTVGEDELGTVMPQGISPEDVLGIGIAGGAALINLSSNFYRCAQQMDSLEERLMVYALVNTLVDLGGIDRVRFYVEGEVVDSFAHDVYLGAELIRNPGIIQAP